MSSNHDSNGDGRDAPLSPLSDGRDGSGKFAAGNRLGRGNPHAARVNQIRAALMEACEPADIKAAAVAIVALAKSGDLKAFAEILDRTIGRAVPMDLEERLTALEAAIAERNEVRR